MNIYLKQSRFCTVLHARKYSLAVLKNVLASDSTVLESLEDSVASADKESTNRRDHRRSRYQRDQVIHPLLYKVPRVEPPLSFRVWSRSEDEVLVKRVLEQIGKIEFRDLSCFVNYYDPATKEISSSPDLSNLRKPLENADIHEEISDEEKLIRTMPWKYDMNNIDWEKVSESLPYRSHVSCKTRFRWLVQLRKPSVIRSEVTGKVYNSSLEIPAGEKGRFEEKWSRYEIQRLRYGMLIHGSPYTKYLTSQTRKDDFIPKINWKAISYYVGKSELTCKRKWEELESRCRLD